MDQLVGSIDQDNLRIVVDELGQAFDGAGDDLGRLHRQRRPAARPRRAVAAADPALITDGQTVLDTQVDEPLGDPAVGLAICGWSPTPWSSMDPDLRELVVNAPDAARRCRALVEDAGPGLGPLVRNLDILNQVTIPRLDGVEQMLVTYPDAVSGGFSVVRRDADGVHALALRVRGQRRRPACLPTGYVPTAPRPARAPSRTPTSTRSSAGVVNGRDPEPGDGDDETGSNIRGEQNIGRDGGTGSSGPLGPGGRAAAGHRRPRRGASAGS